MSDWLEQAKKKREESARIRATIPKADAFHRGQLIAALNTIGTNKGNFSGELVEGDAFFARQPTGDLRSLLEDMWYLRVRGDDTNDYEPPDVPDVEEPEFKPTSCRCNCGYTCSRGNTTRPKCELDIMECMEKHYAQDCDHDFTGEWIEFEDGRGGSVTCTHCGMTSMSHSMRVGP
jgi:hypothetical protein